MISDEARKKLRELAKPPGLAYFRAKQVMDEEITRLGLSGEQAAQLEGVMLQQFNTFIQECVIGHATAEMQGQGAQDEPEVEERIC